VRLLVLIEYPFKKLLGRNAVVLAVDAGKPSAAQLSKVVTEYVIKRTDNSKANLPSLACPAAHHDIARLRQDNEAEVL
jgi:microcompartment protein CcmL/EutN